MNAIIYDAELKVY